MGGSVTIELSDGLDAGQMGCANQQIVSGSRSAPSFDLSLVKTDWLVSRSL
jgi:hypothetical protein